MHTDPIGAFIFDIDGTLALMDKERGTYTALPGAADALSEARQRNMPVVAYTNGTFFPPAHYYPLLAEAGLIFDEGHILTPAVVAAGVLKANGHDRVMVLADDGVRIPLADEGIEIVEPVKGAPDVSAVMIGYTRALTSDTLEAVVGAVWAGAQPYTSSVAPHVASSKGNIMGIPGAISAAIAHCTGISPSVMGKPSLAGMQIACELMGIHAEQTAVIGDDPTLEIAMGRAAGALTIGLTTGAYSREDFMNIEPAARAHLVKDTLQDLFKEPALHRSNEV